MKSKSQNFRVGDKVIVTNPFGHKTIEIVKEIFNEDKIKTDSGAIIDKKAVEKIK